MEQKVIGTKIKDTQENLLVLAIYMLSKKTSVDEVILEKLQHKALDPVSLTSSLIPVYSADKPISKGQAFGERAFEIMQKGKSAVLNLIGIVGEATLKIIFKQGHECAYADLDYLKPEKFADSSYERLENWKRLFSMMLLYQTNKMERWFGANYREGEFIDHRYLVTSLIGRKIKLIVNARNDEERKEEIAHLDRFVNSVKEYNKGALIATQSDDTASLSLATTLLAVIDVIGDEIKVQDNQNYLKELGNIIKKLPNKLMNLIDEIENMLFRLTLPSTLTRYHEKFASLSITSQYVPNSKFIQDLEKYGFKDYYEKFFLNVKGIAQGLSEIDARFLNENHKFIDLTEFRSDASSFQKSYNALKDDVEKIFVNKNYFPFGHANAAEIFEQTASMINARNKLLFVRYYVTSLEHIVEKSGQIGAYFIKDEIRQLFEILKIAIVEFNKYRCAFINACASIYPNATENKMKEEHQKWRMNFVMYNRGRLESELKTVFEMANHASLLLVNGLIHNPADEIKREIRAVCLGVQMFFGVDDQLRQETEMHNALCAPSEEVISYQEKTSNILQIEVVSAQHELMDSFLEVNVKVEDIEAELEVEKDRYKQLNAEKDDYKAKFLELEKKYKSQQEASSIRDRMLAENDDYKAKFLELEKKYESQQEASSIRDRMLAEKDDYKAKFLELEKKYKSQQEASSIKDRMLIANLNNSLHKIYNKCIKLKEMLFPEIIDIKFKEYFWRNKINSNDYKDLKKYLETIMNYLNIYFQPNRTLNINEVAALSGLFIDAQPIVLEILSNPDLKDELLKKLLTSLARYLTVEVVAYKDLLADTSKNTESLKPSSSA